MKLNYTYILFLFFTIITSAQSTNDKIIEVDYEYSFIQVRANNNKYSYYEKLQLFPGKQLSVYDKITKNNSDNAATLKPNAQQGLEWNPKGKNLNTVFKDYKEGTTYLKDIIIPRFFVIKDSINIFNWKVTEEYKEILDYKCQKATTEFRGRNYTAWFTTDLPPGGPWKFDDLPGFILEAYSNDKDNYSWKAQSIRFNDLATINSAIFTNPFLEDKKYSWDEFKKLYKEKAIAADKFQYADGQVGGVVMRRMIKERYIEENDTDYTADKKYGIK
ncbi:GLPGLI family protein [Flavobacterium johnsoniae]|uniref:GLPGLI family protein n=1 Tax=Flavobacterium johnsoniae TaxID=986 RepID=UPI0025B25E95|nr:GLPGLI family protein [Flavobacterium johnsoniae]WJS96839.1 GLPGLI family protein [Flavobacterium johnsoniae]